MTAAKRKLNNQLKYYGAFGTIVSLIGVVVLYLWSSDVKLDAAAIAPGVIAVESNRKSIEHLEGGIIEDIYVQEGQEVTKGQLLVKLSDITAKGNFNQITSRLINAVAQRDRLESERLGLEKPVFSDLVTDAMLIQAEVVNLVARQTSLFFSRRQLQRSELAVLDARLKRIWGEKGAMSRKLEQQNRAYRLLKEEQNMHDKLIEDGYSSKLRSIELQRSGAMLLSDIVALTGSLDNLDLAVAEVNEQKANKTNQYITEIDREHQELSRSIEELSEELKKATDVLSRVEVRSPRDGKVIGLNVHSEGEVVAPAEKLLEVVPVNDMLIVEAFLHPQDIDDVTHGQEALIRLGSYNFRTTPLLRGKVINIAADRIHEVEDESGNSGYKIKVEIYRESLNEHPQLSLYPGMPAEVYVTLKKRTLMDYLLEPLSVGMLKAFRET